MASSSRLGRPLGRHSLASLLRVAGMSEAWQIIIIMVVAAIARFWLLDSKGLRYDEAATALMARATPAEIVMFHWQAAFEHMPLWALFMAGWSRLFGQSEVMLRMPSVLAGIALIPLLWLLLRETGAVAKSARLLAAGLVALGPLLTLYSQDARMYSLVTLVAVASAYIWLRLLKTPDLRLLAAFVALNWAMIGFQYYSAVVVGVEGLFLVLIMLAERKLRLRPLLALALSVVPLILWVIFAPSFHTTLRVLVETTDARSSSGIGFLGKMWREFTFGAVRYQPRQATIGYLLAPVFLTGLGIAVWPGFRRSTIVAGPSSGYVRLFLALAAACPLLVSLVFEGSVSSRYIMFCVPFVYVITALGVEWLWQERRIAGVVGLIMVACVSVWGLGYYYREYEKIGYRDVAGYVESHAQDGEALVLEAPRQHLLTKYYLPSFPAVYPVPAITLPAYWPANAPHIVPQEVDHYLQDILRKHLGLWLILTGEDEVDPQEFVQSYLMAISYSQDCHAWTAVRLCHFVAAESVPTAYLSQANVMFGPDMQLGKVQIATRDSTEGQRYMFVALNWTATNKPAKDYKVSLRLLDPGGQVASQSDSAPIGPLLPATTWNAGDDKTGYMVLALPKQLTPGDYQVSLGLYDPSSLELLPVLGAQGTGETTYRLATVRVGADQSLSYLTPN